MVPVLLGKRVNNFSNYHSALLGKMSDLGQSGTVSPTGSWKNSFSTGMGFTAMVWRRMPVGEGEGEEEVRTTCLLPGKRQKPLTSFC